MKLPRKTLATLMIAATLLGVNYVLFETPVGALAMWSLRTDRPRQGSVAKKVTGLTQNITVPYDEHGVPYIITEREADAWRGMGYVHARDRRFQMEVLRYAAQGRLRELFPIGKKGDKFLSKIDRTNRILGFEGDADLMLEHARDSELELLQAYVDGVNAGTESEPLPLEFEMVDHYPEPWTIRDSVRIVAMLSYSLSKNWTMEMHRLEMAVHALRHGQDLDRALQVWPTKLPMGPYIVTDNQDRFGGSVLDPLAVVEEVKDHLRNWPLDPPVKAEDLARTKGARLGHKAQSSTLESAYVASLLDFSWCGSNNWAVSGVHTASGGALVAGDPHLKHGMPPLFYLFGMSCDEYTVTGASIPGLPGALSGSNGKVAWTETSNWADNQDLYLIVPDPEKPGRYLYDGKSYPFTVRTEIFRMKKNMRRYREETVEIRETRHGIIINDLLDRLPEDFPLVALKRTKGGVTSHAITGLRRIAASKDVHEIREALEEMTSFQGHWVFGDAEGNIGYYGVSNLPVRLRHAGTFPAPGWTSRYEWSGMYPSERLPGIINPESGILATANSQTIDPAVFPVPINYEGDSSARTARILERLEELKLGGITIDEMMELQDDARNQWWIWLQDDLAPLMEDLASHPDPLVSESAGILAQWDGVSKVDSVGATLFHGLVTEMLHVTLHDEMPRESLESLKDYFNAEPLLYNLLSDPENPGWDNTTTDLVETQADGIAESMERLVANLAQVHGEDPAMWRWGNICSLTMKHPFGQKKALANLFNRGPYEVSGAPNTVFKNQYARFDSAGYAVQYGPVYRIAVDLGDPETGRFVIPGGQSGRVASKHYDDLLPLFLEGKGIPLRLDHGEILAQAETVVQLVP